MATHLKYFIRILKQYVSVRFGFFQYATITVSLCILATTEIIELLRHLESFVFIFVSLFVFRILDDTWSFHLDRIDHPQRLYLKPQFFSYFIGFTVFVVLSYQIVLIIIDLKLAVIIFILLAISVFLYVFFYKKRQIMHVIPLLKYPVLIASVSQFSMSAEVWFLAVGAFFMMLSRGYMKANEYTTGTLKYKVLLLLVTGIFVFHPWFNSYSNFIIDLILISLPVFLVLFSKMKEEPFFPVVTFPSLHLLHLMFV
jgi:hypothetical protein